MGVGVKLPQWDLNSQELSKTSFQKHFSLLLFYATIVLRFKKRNQRKKKIKITQ
jgi:hypothetical protein